MFTTDELMRTAAIDTVDGVIQSTLRVSGASATSLDGFDTVLSTIIEVHMNSQTDVTALRDKLFPKLLIRAPAEVAISPAPWTGQLDTEFIVTFQSTYRADVAQTLYMGAVVRKVDYDNRVRPSAIFADDMANGTGSTVSGNGEEIECEEYYADRPASADIIWIIDETLPASMLPTQTRSTGLPKAAAPCSVTCPETAATRAKFVTIPSSSSSTSPMKSLMRSRMLAS
ncbi:MAG: hypothetical protein GY811_00980 [Myxococcales bacterium]|nr:hypothetical protein [Myxococcales bacterium]